jgi:hypothetical protein
MRLSNFTLKRKLKKESSGFIAVLHFTVTGGSLIMRITLNLKEM